MLYGMYLSAAGAMVEDARQAVIANNLANSSTSGFKADTASFRRRLTEAGERLIPPGRPDPLLEGLSGGVFLDEVSFSNAAGPVSQTGNPFDIALRGDGFLAVSDGTNTLYTRSGSFQRNGKGELVSADGRFKVLGADGKPIVLGKGEVRIGPRGDISVDGRPAGRLLLQGKLDPTLFQKVGETYFRWVGKGAPPAAAPDVLQGFLEGSNVSPVGEMVKLIQSQRAYEANLQMARIQDGSLGRAVNELARVSA